MKKLCLVALCVLSCAAAELSLAAEPDAAKNVIEKRIVGLAEEFLDANPQYRRAFPPGRFLKKLREDDVTVLTPDQAKKLAAGEHTRTEAALAEAVKLEEKTKKYRNPFDVYLLNKMKAGKLSPLDREICYRLFKGGAASRCRRNDAMMGFRAKNVVRACMMYQADKGVLPARLQDVIGKYIRNREALEYYDLALDKKAPWLYYRAKVIKEGGKRLLIAAPMVYENERMVGWADGSVTKLSEDAFRKLTGKAK